MMRHSIVRQSVALALACAGATVMPEGRAIGQEGFRFHSSVELVNVTATVTDSSGHFVPGLKQTDFLVFEDDQPVDVTHFSSERVAVSLGIVLDTSGSMDGAEDRCRAGGSRAAPLRSARRRRRSVPLSVRQRTSPRRGLDQQSESHSRRAPPPQDRRRHGALRCRSPGASTPSVGSPSQESAPRHLRRQRHQQQDRPAAAEAADSRIGGARLRDWNRRPNYRRDDRKRCDSRCQEVRPARTTFPDSVSVSRSESPSADSAGARNATRHRTSAAPAADPTVRRTGQQQHAARVEGTSRSTPTRCTT